MLIPSIDIMNGSTVQLVGGQALELDAGDPRPIAERFALVGEIAVVDLDAALGRGSNTALIEELLPRGACRVGGGIRSYERAVFWLDAGAAKIVLGTAATPQLLGRLPRERVIAALDAVEGEVVTHGWQTRTGQSVLERLDALRGLVGGFLVTFVEREGRLGGTRLEGVPELVAAAGDARVTIAGGVSTTREVAQLDEMGADAQIGMALYKGLIPLADGFAAPLVSDRPDGLWPTVVTDEQGIALGLAYSSPESLRAAIDARRGIYHSRQRGLWAKGEVSGAVQELLRVTADCDRDTLRFTVRQRDPGFCHQQTRTCWGPDAGLPALYRRLSSRAIAAPLGSYTRRLLEDPQLLRSKLLEEARELAEAGDAPHAAREAADLIYFALVSLIRNGAALQDVERELNHRALRVSRRAGDAKTEDARS